MISTTEEITVRLTSRLSIPAARPTTRSAPIAGDPANFRGTLRAILTTSACVHLLVAASIGFGIHEDPVRLPKPAIPATKIIEDVKLEQLPPPPKEEQPLPETLPSVAAPTVAANIDLPPLPPLTEISAVPASVPVAFAIPVTGPVRLVKDAAHASGAVGGRPSNASPVSVDTGEENARFLLLPLLQYPAIALERRISGTAQVEFKTSPTGDIYDVRVRTSSGFTELDRAALQNMKHGRWTGEAGYFVKKFAFILN